MTYLKIIKSKRIYPVPREIVYEIEVEAMRRLTGHDQFPELLEVREHAVLMTHCGTAYNLLDNKPIIYDAVEQATRIIDTLKDKRVAHLDFWDTHRGSNLCIKEGKLYLIDFGQAVIDEEPVNLWATNRLWSMWKKQGGYNGLYDRILKLVTNV